MTSPRRNCGAQRAMHELADSFSALFWRHLRRIFIAVPPAYLHRRRNGEREERERGGGFCKGRALKAAKMPHPSPFERNFCKVIIRPRKVLWIFERLQNQLPMNDIEYLPMGVFPSRRMLWFHTIECPSDDPWSSYHIGRANPFEMTNIREKQRGYFKNDFIPFLSPTASKRNERT